jgi:predicted nucleic acid-binding protein
LAHPASLRPEKKNSAGWLCFSGTPAHWRYFAEVVSDTADALIDNSLPHALATTPWGYAETYSVLLRRLNGGAIDLPAFTTAATALQAEVVSGSNFGLLSISDAMVFASTGIMRQHNLNATDAAILALLLDYSQVLPSGRSGCVIVACCAPPMPKG